MDEVAVNALLRRLVVVGRNAQYARDTFVETRLEFGGNLCAIVAPSNLARGNGNRGGSRASDERYIPGASILIYLE